MWSSTLTYQAALRAPHRRAVRVDVYDINGEPRALGLRPSGGSVSAALTNRVTRTAEFTLTRDWYPLTADDPLSPEHAVVRIWGGIEYATGAAELFPLFVGRVWDAALGADGQVAFGCQDLAADVVAYRFEQPRTTTTGQTLAEIRRLIREAVPQAVFGTDTVADAPTPLSLTWDEDRGQALDDLAQSLGGRWYALGDGTFVVRPFNYVTGPVAQEFRDGPGGLLTVASVPRSRAGVSNSVVVVSERADGTAPIRVPARDTATDSPTRFGGLFGRVSEVIKVQTPLSFPQAQTLAQTQLRAGRALTRQWDASVVPDYSIEPGDTVSVQFMHVRDTQIIDSITYPLDTQTPMTFATRAGLGA
ncbi:DUF5047 domain-containing protein [Streptomyces sp. NPDC056049]|uniref:DUF5047 domain-containing protein n=1 Tax=Streptomyces sp. NPDC056049 TaxID=3345693 RepID=UPI0035DE5DCA